MFLCFDDVCCLLQPCVQAGQRCHWDNAASCWKLPSLGARSQPQLLTSALVRAAGPLLLLSTAGERYRWRDLVIIIHSRVEAARSFPSISEHPTCLYIHQALSTFSSLQVDRLMDLIVNSLYSNRDVFLRELVSNGAWKQRAPLAFVGWMRSCCPTMGGNHAH